MFPENRDICLNSHSVAMYFSKFNIDTVLYLVMDHILFLSVDSVMVYSILPHFSPVSTVASGSVFNCHVSLASF